MISTGIIGIHSSNESSIHTANVRGNAFCRYSIECIMDWIIRNYKQLASCQIYDINDFYLQSDQLRMNESCYNFADPSSIYNEK